MKTKKNTVLGQLRKDIEDQEKGERDDLECAKCGLKKYLTVDHIIPQFFLLNLCLEDEIYNFAENFEILCKFCNQEKAHKINIRHPKTFYLLEEIIRRAKSELKN